MIWNIFCEKKNEIYRSFIAMLIYGTVICLGAASFGVVEASLLLVVFIAFMFIYVVCLFELTIVGKAILWSITIAGVVVKIISSDTDSGLSMVKCITESASSVYSRSEKSSWGFCLNETDIS